MTTALKTRTEYETTAECAKRVRACLKETFPGHKFSVRSENFSMGDAVRIGWTDGPRESEVRAITQQFQEGYFDGMQDMYVNDTERGTLAADPDGTIVRRYEGVKYVSTSRDISDGARKFAEDMIAMVAGEPYEPNKRYGLYIDGAREYERREGRKLAVRKISGREEYGSRLVCELLYNIEFKAPAKAKKKGGR